MAKKAASATKPAAKEKSKSALAREYHKANPKATTQEIADKLGISYNAVYQAVNKPGKKKKGKPGRKQGKPSTNGIAAVEAIKLAREFANKVGGTNAAAEILKALG